MLIDYLEPPIPSAVGRVDIGRRSLGFGAEGGAHARNVGHGGASAVCRPRVVEELLQLYWRVVDQLACYVDRLVHGVGGK